MILRVLKRSLAEDPHVLVLPAPEVALLLLLETVLGPLWVWLGIDEVPSPAAFLGGGIVVCTLVLHSIWRLRRPTPPPGHPDQ